MKKFLLVCIIFFTSLTCNAENYTLEAGVSINDIPKALYGNWRVNAKLEDSNSYGTFKPASIDFWTLTRVGDKVSLSNPFSGANSEINLKTVEGNIISFSKKAPYDNKLLTDTVTIRLEKSSFRGINTLTLETFSPVDKHIIKTENARYLIKGEKISGDSILDK